MAGIAKCHLGDIAGGAEMLRRAIAAAPDDPHRFRHLREQAVIHLMEGEADAALEVCHRLVGQAPDLARNKLVLASLTAIAGDGHAARQIVAGLMAEYPGLTIGAMRPIHIGDSAVAERHVGALLEAGVPER